MDGQLIKVALCVVLMSYACESRISNFKESYYEEWKSHMRHTRSMGCARPQPRVVPADELKDCKDLTSLGHNIIPHETVLNRCHLTGCCQKGYTCEPLEWDEVELVFVDRTENRFFTVTAKNHTRCECEPKHDTPKR